MLTTRLDILAPEAERSIVSQTCPTRHSVYTECPCPMALGARDPGRHSADVGSDLQCGETDVSSLLLSGFGLWEDPRTVENLLAGSIETYGVVPTVRDI